MAFNYTSSAFSFSSHNQRGFLWQQMQTKAETHNLTLQREMGSIYGKSQSNSTLQTIGNPFEEEIERT